MPRSFIALLTLTLLTGCAAIPYDKPQDQLNIQKDLSVKPEEIVTMTQVNWCSYAYGEVTPCHSQEALAVQTRTKLILASYNKPHYKTIVEVQASDVMCAHLQAPVDTAPNLFLFTHAYAVQIWPVEPSSKPDIAKKKLIVDTMLQTGKRTIVGTEKDYIRDTGQGRTGMAMIPNTVIPYSTRTSILHLINPCSF
ncbi:hypothetical protein [Pseudomonas sp. 25 R 14]|uniref:hypothetical protein n=1 Tax=Pseudomonas sp. 25 R 14 TaxID=1844109 RepID=UPI0008124334|nr:hypothetical protein [Pseudomonas sp. 25 R 14]CRM57293.1 hypothetical protein [Pseudomonas sp. 25 R 14]